MPTIDSAKVYVYAAGADPTTATPLYISGIGISMIIGGQPPIATPSSPSVNPTLVYWNDTAVPGTQAHAAIAPLTLAPGLYDLRMTTTIAGVESAKSAPWPIQVLPPAPPVPSGVEAK
jgi:hypothetical protein